MNRTCSCVSIEILCFAFVSSLEIQEINHNSMHLLDTMAKFRTEGCYGIASNACNVMWSYNCKFKIYFRKYLEK